MSPGALITVDVPAVLAKLTVDPFKLMGWEILLSLFVRVMVPVPALTVKPPPTTKAVSAAL